VQHDATGRELTHEGRQRLGTPTMAVRSVLLTVVLNRAAVVMTHVADGTQRR
jgi:hypothetical protein